jgi:hypothetical protein
MSNRNSPAELGQGNGDVADPLADWGVNAPRGGRTVLKRMLKGDGKVPLFLGQTLIKSLRDQGYNTTTSALCEFVLFKINRPQDRSQLRADLESVRVCN